MPNGLSPFLVASRGFRQAPVGTPLGALAQALAGFTGGLGAAQQQAFQRRQQAALGQALTGLLPQAQPIQPAGILRPQPTQPTPLGQLFGQQPTAVQPAVTQPAAQVAPIDPQTIQSLSQLNPQLAAQLVGQARTQAVTQQQARTAREQKLADIESKRQFERDLQAIKFADEQALQRQKIAGDIRKEKAKGQIDIPKIEEGDTLLGGVPIQQLHQTKAGIQAQKRLDSTVKTKLQLRTNEVAKINANANRFKQLMKDFEPGAFSVERGFIAFAKPKARAAFEGMRAIRDKLAIQQREPGTGIMTDKDFEVYSGIVPGPDKQRIFNEQWIEATKRFNQSALDKQKFFNIFERKFRNLQGAEAAWQEYMLSNPVFAEESTPENPVFNPNRVEWKEYFGLEKKAKPVTQEVKTIGTKFGLNL